MHSLGQLSKRPRSPSQLSATEADKLADRLRQQLGKVSAASWRLDNAITGVKRADEASFNNARNELIGALKQAWDVLE